MALSRITAGSIADGTVVAADIADGSITTAKIADANVTASKIATDAVTGISDGTSNVSVTSTNGDIIVGTAGSEKVRVTTAGRVGIGALVPAAQLDVIFPGNTTTGLKLEDSAGGNLAAYAQFYNTSGTAKASIQNANNDGTHLNVGTSGSLCFATGYTSANALDDYEEGTWTPTFLRTTSNPSLTYSSQLGTYTKIGRLVYVECLLVVTAVSSQGSGYVYIAGLPFENGGGTYRNIGIFGYNDTFADAGQSISRAWASGTTFRLIGTGETQADYQSNLSTGYCAFSGTYFVA